MKLEKVNTIEIIPTAPFNFDATFHKPGHFPSTDNYWQPNIKWQTWFWAAQPLGLKFKNQGTLNKPKIAVDIHSISELDYGSLDSLKQEIIYKYCLDMDLTDFYSKFKNDQILGLIIKKWQGMRHGHPGSLYEFLIIGFMLQNATVKRSIHMLQSLFENYGTKISYDGKQLYCYWPPGRFSSVSEDQLRALKLGYRAKFIKKIDEQFSQGIIQELGLRKLPRDQLKEKLLEIYGVGPATVWYLLQSMFHYYNYFDHISPWEQKIYSKIIFNRDPENPVPVKKLLKYFQKYLPYQQLAVHYLWEDLWWRHQDQPLAWLQKLIRR